eukprot:SAG31_NODE_2071_length_6515_cov_2.490804_5_plen_156_part_00
MSADDGPSGTGNALSEAALRLQKLSEEFFKQETIYKQAWESSQQLQKQKQQEQQERRQRRRHPTSGSPSSAGNVSPTLSSISNRCAVVPALQSGAPNFPMISDTSGAPALNSGRRRSSRSVPSRAARRAAEAERDLQVCQGIFREFSERNPPRYQ